jgi:hypothetical protein
MHYGTVDIDVCDFPPPGIGCEIVGHATLLIAEICTKGKKAGGWAKIEGQDLGDQGAKIVCLE